MAGYLHIEHMKFGEGSFVDAIQNHLLLIDQHIVAHQFQMNGLDSRLSMDGGRSITFLGGI